MPTLLGEHNTPSIEETPHQQAVSAHAAARPQSKGNVVLVHSGARDAYQLALALSEAGLLNTLVTDLFWPAERGWAKVLARFLPASVLALLSKRTAPGLPASAVTMNPIGGLGGLVLDKLPSVPFALRRGFVRSADAALGRTAGRQARRTGAGLVSYSYYGYDAFKEYGPGGMLFQVHPHPATMRRILREELEAHPDCASSLQQEWELSLPEDDFQHLVSETTMASGFLAASSFTRESLIENGAPRDAIRVVPYGVDLQRFHPDPARVQTPQSPLRLLFVGRINQRKGVKYLLEALRLFDIRQVELTMCGRVLDDLELFRPFASQVKIRPSVSAEELVRAYQSADLLVFPSVGEGFGHVLLESLACGLPVLSTTHTAAPDLIEDGLQGFIVPPRRPDLLAEKIQWALTHRAELAAMGPHARTRAEHFTWDRFRAEAARAVEDFLAAQSPSSDQGAAARLTHV